MHRVLVDVDGPQGSKEALRWALDQARCRGATLTVMLVAAPAYL